MSVGRPDRNVFERAGGLWTQQAKLAPADRDSGDFFGKSVVVADGTTALSPLVDEQDDRAVFRFIHAVTDDVRRVDRVR